MKHISKLQKKILEKVFLYNNKNFSVASFFCVSSYGLGFYQMKLWIDRKNIFKFILAFLKEIYAMINANNYEVKRNLSNLNNFKNIVITWGNDTNIKNNLFIDKYFNTSNKDHSTLWIVMFSGKKVFYQNNVIFIIPKKINFINKIINFIIFIFNLLIEKKNLHNFTNNHFTSIKLEKIFNVVFKNLHLNNSCKFFFPYESQPFQNNLIKNIQSYKKKIKVYGYINSYPAFPSHLIKKTISPDFLIVNSKDQVYSFTKFLKWKNKDIIFLPSIRFKKRILSDLSKKIFLPIDFNSVEDICKEIKYLSKIYNLKEFEIKNHPESQNSKKHNKLINEITKIICFNDESQLKIKIPIFIGSTGAIIEALNNGFEPIHILEDEEFEIYSETLWPSIKMNVMHEKIVSYKLIRKNIVSIKKNFLFDRYLKLN